MAALPAVTHAQFSSIQAGSVASGNTPVFSISSAIGWLDRPGWPMFGVPQTFCASAAADAGISAATPVLCVYGSYSWQMGVNGLPNGGGLGVGGGCLGLSCGGTFTFTNQYIQLFTNTTVPLTSACPVENGTVPPGNIWPGFNSSCEVFTRGTSTPTPPALPTASLSASPSLIVQGNSSALTHSCGDATSATISSVGTVSPTAATTAVSPTTTTTYTLTCTNAAGSSTAAATVTVVPTLSASCTVSPTALTTGGSATWSATASGGVGGYTYSWSGTNLSGTGQTTTATYATAGTYTGSVTVTSGTQSQTFACGNSVTVTAPPVVPPPTTPDLTTSSITPTSATAGQAVTLAATASNIGTAASGAFPVLFQVQSPNDLRASGYLASLAPSASAPATVGYTFPTAGAYQVRACANNNTSWTNIVPESNYGNNCGPWTTVTVAAAPATPTPALSCTVSDPTPPIGGSSTFSVTGASAPFTWTGEDGTVYGGTGSSITRTFTQSGNFSMTASKPGFTSCTANVSVGTAACVNPAGTLSANPTRIQPGNASTLTYSASGIATSCTLRGPGVNQTFSATSCTVPQGTVSTGPLLTQSLYILTCDGVERARTLVNVVPRFEEF